MSLFDIVRYTEFIIDYDVSNRTNRDKLPERLETYYSFEELAESSDLLSTTKLASDLIADLCAFVSSRNGKDSLVVNEIEGSTWDAYPDQAKSKTPLIAKDRYEVGDSQC